MTARRDDPLVSPEWLHERLARVVPVDATYFLPPDPARVRAAFAEKHIPGARLFEIDEIADRSTSLPHMMPDGATFASAVGTLGIGPDDTVVIYDRSDNHFSAPRVWFTFRAFGHGNVRVLDGGLRAWEKMRLPIESGFTSPERKLYPERELDAHAIVSLDAVHTMVDRGGSGIVDVRAKGRFEGTVPEPRPGLRGGHMPGSKNLPFADLTGPDGRFLGAEALKKAFAAAGIDPARPVAASCGSGLTAAVLALGLARIGRDDAAIYDGSWTEWAARDDTPVVKGPA